MRQKPAPVNAPAMLMGKHGMWRLFAEIGASSDLVFAAGVKISEIPVDKFPEKNKLPA